MSDRPTLLLFGAGNIGRSFLAPIFSGAGYQVVFVDVNPAVIAAVNDRCSYQVVTVVTGLPDRERTVTGIRAVDGRDGAAVSREIAEADLAATAVGQSALPAVARTLAAGLELRARVRPGAPLDVILAENVRGCAALVRRLVDEASPGAAARLGLVETSIGKMVPIVPAGRAAADPLVVYAEPYNTLIVDRRGFLGPVPEVADLEPVDRIDAYVDRKLFIHNMGHAAAAYLGYGADPSIRLLADALAVPTVGDTARQAMSASAAALVRTYPDVFTPAELLAHVDDLLTRFANRALGDTVYRVGRDLRRKLARDDRLVGAMLLCAAQEVPFEPIARTYRAALTFAAPEDAGAVHHADAEFVLEAARRGVEWVLTGPSGLVPGRSADDAVIRTVLAVD